MEQFRYHSIVCNCARGGFALCSKSYVDFFFSQSMQCKTKHTAEVEISGKPMFFWCAMIPNFTCDILQKSKLVLSKKNPKLCLFARSEYNYEFRFLKLYVMGFDFLGHSPRESRLHCTSENKGPLDKMKFCLRYQPRTVWKRLNLTLVYSWNVNKEW